MINKQKISTELLKKEEDEKNEIDFDLWPDIDKEYVRDDDEENEDFENDIELEI